MEVPNEWIKKDYRLASDYLKKLWNLQLSFDNNKLPDHVLNLRKGNQKIHRESYQVALFLTLFGIIDGNEYAFTTDIEENDDMDAIAQRRGGEFIPIQLKELVPEDLNSSQTIEKLLRVTCKYSNPDLVVCVYCNRDYKIVNPIEIPEDIKLSQVWLFGLSNKSPTKFSILGNLLSADAEIHVIDMSEIFATPQSGKSINLK